MEKGIKPVQMASDTIIISRDEFLQKTGDAIADVLANRFGAENVDNDIILFCSTLAASIELELFGEEEES